MASDAGLLTVKIIMIFVIYGLGVLGLVSPRFFKPSGVRLQYAQLLSAGVLLSAGMVHLLGEGSEELAEAPLPEFPWAFVMASLSFLVLFSVEKMASLYHTAIVYEQQAIIAKQSEKDKEKKEKAKDTKVEVELQQQSPTESQKQEDGHKHEHGHKHSHSHEHDKTVESKHNHHHYHHEHGDGNAHVHSEADETEEEHDHAAEMLDSLQNSSSFVNALVLLVALSLHNLLESLSLGAADTSESVTTLSAAICAHHYLASFSLGCAILKAKKSARATWTIALLYGLTEPIGIAIGIGIRQEAESWVSAMLICFASGTFLFVAIVEILIPAFEKDHHHQHHVVLDSKAKFSFKDEMLHLLTKIGFVFYGFILLSLLAIWA